MNINYFFLAVSFLLLTILFAFKPLEIKEQPSGDVPLFSITSFVMYELDIKGLITTMNGTTATRYKDRYKVEEIDYTDSSKEYIANMKSKSGVYKDDVVYLDGNIVYKREDGLTFETQKATYNKKTTLAIADGEYLLYRGENRVIGKGLHYNSSQETVSSKDVTAKYQIEERKK
ncbi:MAG: LPS export ABC transporter periplasmic protein LptC [Sulfurimonas sp.]|uniref:LPS export ABC transporter periplasmic protein LptC n=1 Tax=Sulfurimonas sp. TaxID=2022749 RepID=UPI002627461D|nr:LPS export ABC transporter periplasmic protein LptC [Sulfurimonas sp.]MDD2652612.1 LPS export ABC transporter periplasmic protein LptC [Sulfurimonas sp.]MDD3450754.1 LPS export ABC transporter periplasmic protein LptC [Sulfurimonas sp.]